MTARALAGVDGLAVAGETARVGSITGGGSVARPREDQRGEEVLHVVWLRSKAGVYPSPPPGRGVRGVWPSQFPFTACPTERKPTTFRPAASPSQPGPRRRARRRRRGRWSPPHIARRRPPR